MNILDDEGNLFGTINVIDALVVLVVIAVVVGGLAVVGVLGTDDPDTNDSDTNESSPDDSEIETHYVAVDIGDTPRHMTDRIQSGDVMSTNETNTTITDVYETPTSATTSSVLLGVEIETADSYRTGQTIELEFEEYTVEGSLLRIEDSPPAVDITPVTVDLKVESVDQDTADAIVSGSQSATQERSLVTINNVTTESPRESDDRYDVRLTVELGTVETAGGPQFHSTPIRVGNSVSLDLGNVEIESTISNIHTQQ